MTIGDSRAHYMDMVPEEQFRGAQDDAAYNNHLL